MKRLFLTIAIFCLCFFTAFSQENQQLTTINKKVKLIFSLDESVVLHYAGSINLDSNFVVVKTATKLVVETLKPV